jgi:hypothetical protein
MHLRSDEPASANGAGWWSLEQIGQTGGAVTSVELSGQYAYVGVGPRVVVLDISDPRTPTPVGQGPVFPNLVQDLEMVQGHLVVGIDRPATPSGNIPIAHVNFVGEHIGVNGTGVMVLDLADPTRPRVVADVELPGEARRVIVVGDRLFVGGGWTGIDVLDVSNPHAPLKLGRTRDFLAFDLAVVGSTIYASQGDTELAVGCDRDIRESIGGDLIAVDAQDPSQMQQEGPWWDHWGARVTADDRSIYAASKGEVGAHVVRIVDVTSSEAPRTTAQMETKPFVTRLLARDGLLYITDATGLAVIDVSDQFRPQQLGYVEVGREAWDLTVSGNLAFVATRRDGLKVVDLSDPAVPQVVGSYRPIGMVDRVVAMGDYLVATDTCAVNVVDWSDPRHPEPRLRADPQSPLDDYGIDITDVAVLGDSALIGIGAGEHGGGLLRLRPASGEKPRLEPTVQDVARVASIAVDGDRVYLGVTVRAPEEHFEVRVLEAGDGGGLEPAGAAMVPWEIATLTVGGGFAYGAEFAPGQFGMLMPRLMAVDVSQHSHPRRLSLDLSELDGIVPTSVAIAGHYLVVADGPATNGIEEVVVAEVLEPQRPQRVAAIPLDARRAMVLDRRIYLATMWGVDVWDVTEPTHPSLLAHGAVAAGARDAFATDDYVYVAAREGGLAAFRAAQGPLASQVFLPHALSGAP